jgi:PiT family inorganic phosphate transporter
MPVSTTHVIAGAIAGVGSIQRMKAVRWGLATTIVWAWVLTIPAAALVGAGSLLLIRMFTPNI